MTPSDSERSKNKLSCFHIRGLSRVNPKRIMQGPCGPGKTSTDDPAAIKTTMTCDQLCISFIPDENIFGVRTDPAYTLV